MEARTQDILPDDIRDAGKRASDVVNLHIAFNNWDYLKNCWMAFRLTDGGSDNSLYDTATDAAKHQLHEQQCFYVCFRGLGPAGSKPYEMAKLVMFYRQAYANGMRFVDPDQRVRMPAMTTLRHDVYDTIVKQDAIVRLAREFGHGKRKLS